MFGLFILLGLATLIILVAYVSVVAYEARHPKRITAGWALAHNHLTNPKDVGVPYESWSFDTSDGLSLPVWDIPADQEESKDAPIVVVAHGWARSRLSSLARMEPILRPKANRRRNFRTILYELRGHGDAPPGATTLGNRDVDDLCTLLEQLGDAPVILIGHSLGAVVVIHTAARKPKHVRAVIAIAPYDRLPTPFHGNLQSKSCPGGFLAEGACALLWLRGVRMENTIEAARRTQQPLEILIGERDRITPPNIAKAISDAAPRGRFELLEGVAHSDHHIQQPERLQAALDRALQACQSE